MKRHRRFKYHATPSYYGQGCMCLELDGMVDAEANVPGQMTLEVFQKPVTSQPTLRTTELGMMGSSFIARTRAICQRQ